MDSAWSPSTTRSTSTACNATQRCVAVLFAADVGDTTLRATGTYRDELIYERGGWYFTFP